MLETDERLRRLENRIGDVAETADLAISRFPKNARVDNLGTEGHIHNPLKSGGGGLIHYDYVVDANYTGPSGATVALTTGSTTRLCKTIQAAVTFADADNADTTVFINEGTYAENVVIPTTLINTHSIALIGESMERVLIQPTTGDALTVNVSGGSPGRLRLRNLTMGTSGGFAMIGTAALPFYLTVYDCIFNTQVQMSVLDGHFFNVDFGDGIDIPATYTWETCTFGRCTSLGTNLWEGTINDAYFEQCDFTFQVLDSGSTERVHFSECQFPAAGYQKNGGDIFFPVTIENSDFTGTDVTGGAVYLQSVTTCAGVIVVNNNFNITNSAHPILVGADTGFDNVIFKGNVMGTGAALSSVAVSGTFGRGCVFGPNSPAGFGLSIAAITAPAIYVGTGTVAGAAATTVYTPLPQVAAGVPSHTAPEGQGYWDSTNNNYYTNNNGTTGWTLVGGATATGTPRYNVYLTSGNLDSWLEGATITQSGGTLTLGTDGDMFHVGAGNFSAIATPTRQTLVLLIFDGVSVITHGSNLILQNAANFTSAAGDTMLLAWEGGSVWREILRQLATSVASAGNDNLSLQAMVM